MTDLFAALWSWLPPVDIDVSVGEFRFTYPSPTDDVHTHHCAHVHTCTDDEDEDDPDGPTSTIWRVHEAILADIVEDVAIELGNGATVAEATRTFMTAMTMRGIENNIED